MIYKINKEKVIEVQRVLSKSFTLLSLSNKNIVSF